MLQIGVSLEKLFKQSCVSPIVLFLTHFKKYNEFKCKYVFSKLPLEALNE